MGKLILLLAVFLSIELAYSQGDAPALLKGQGQTSNQVGSFIQVPNNLVTRINSATGLLETGNNNILVNPSFEHSSYLTGWTSSGTGSNAVELVNEIHGLKAVAVTTSSQTIDLSQSSTLYASQFADGVQGLASIRVKTDHTGTCSVCSVQAGTVSTTNCVTVQANSKWGLYKVPMILGATSNGISLACTSGTGTTYVDDAFVGAVDLKADVGNVSNWRNGVCSGTWTTNTAYTCKFRQVGNDLEVQYLITLSGAPNATTLYLNLPSGFNIDTNNLTSTLNQVSFGDGSARDASTNVFFKLNAMIASSSLIGLYYSVNGQIPPTGTSSSTNLAEISATLPTTWASGDTLTATIKVPVTQYSGSGSVYTSTNADTDWASCGHTTSDFTGFGTVSNIETQCKREGSDLLMRGKFTSGTSTAVEARVNLKLGGTSLTSASSSSISSIQMAGDVGRSTNTATENKKILIEPSVTYVTFGESYTTNAILTKRNGNEVAASGNTLALTARIPISGWTNSNLIIGQFNGLESCANTLECTDTFSADVSSTGVVSNENVNWINGNAVVTSTSVYTSTLVSGLATVGMNCVATASSGASVITNMSTSGTTVQYAILNSNTTANQAAGHKIICQKQGADYIGKTAKAVASDQNVRSVGSTGVDIQSVYFGGNATCSTACTTSPCTICNSVGGKITSVTRLSLGTYLINGIDGTKYNCSGTGVTNIYAGHAQLRASSSSSYALMQIGNAAGSPTDSNYNSVTCLGIP